MPAPYQVATSTALTALGYPPQQRVVILCDGSLLTSHYDGSTSAKLVQITSPSGSAPVMTTLAQSFSITGGSPTIASLAVANNGMTSSDVWVVYSANATSTGLYVAHATYTASGGVWNWDNTGTSIGLGSYTGGFMLPSLVWTGATLIVATRANLGGSYRVAATYTTTKNGSSGWAALFDLSGATGGGSHYYPTLLHDATAGCTLAVYSKNGDTVVARVLADTAASPALANWSGEVALSGTVGVGAANLTATLDPSTQKLHVAWCDSTASPNPHYVVSTYTATSITAGTAFSITGGGGTGATGPAIGLDGASPPKAYLFWSSAAAGAASDISYVTITSPYASGNVSGVTNLTNSSANDNVAPALPSQAVMTSSFLPLVYLRSATSAYPIEFDNTISLSSPTVALSGTVASGAALPAALLAVTRPLSGTAPGVGAASLSGHLTTGVHGAIALSGVIRSIGSAPGGAAGGGVKGAISNPSPSLASLYRYKQQLVLVYNNAGQFIDVWRDAPLLAGVKFAINSATSPIMVKLPRMFDAFDEAGTPGARGSIAQGNLVQYWLFGPGLPTSGLLKFQGVIDSYAPEITESGEEGVTVTLTPYDAVAGDSGLLGDQTFGTAGIPAGYVDPLSIFDWWFSNNDPLTGETYADPLTLSGSNPSSSGVTTQYTFSNQNLGSIWETVRQMLPANWFWRINQDGSVTRNVPPVTAQHQFTLGQHVVAPQYRKDWEKLRNVIQVVGTGLTTALTTGLTSSSNYTSLAVAPLPTAVIAGQQLVINSGGNPSQTVTLSAGAAQGATSVSVTSFTANGTYPAQTQVTLLIAATAVGADIATFGKRAMQVADNRVVDQNTAQTLANALLTTYDQMQLRTKIRLVDYRGDAQSGVGYDIETILPGDTCQILNPGNEASANLWDEMQWDVGYWDYSPSATLQQIVVIVSVAYNFDSVDLEIAALSPSQDVELLKLRALFQDFSLGA